MEKAKLLKVTPLICCHPPSRDRSVDPFPRATDPQPASQAEVYMFDVRTNEPASQAEVYENGEKRHFSKAFVKDAYFACVPVEHTHPKLRALQKLFCTSFMWRSFQFYHTLFSLPISPCIQRETSAAPPRGASRTASGEARGTAGSGAIAPGGFLLALRVRSGGWHTRQAGVMICRERQHVAGKALAAVCVLG